MDDFSPVFGKDKRRVSNRSSSLPDQKSAEHSHSNDRYQHSKLFIRRLAEAEIRDKQNADRQHQQMQPDQKVSAAERCKDEQQRQNGAKTNSSGRATDIEVIGSPW